MIMMMREKRDIRPLLLRFGVALALSLGGMLYSILRTKRIRPSQSPPTSPRSSDSDCGNQVDSGEEIVGLKYDNHALEATLTACNPTSIASQKLEDSCLPKITIGNTFSDVSPGSRSNGDKYGSLLPEFNELVKEFDLPAARKDIETSTSDAEMPRGYECVERDDHEQEIKSLRNMVKILKERERTLEIQLLEYYGLKEQETAVMELQNRLKIHNMEAKLFTLKIESLRADNQRLEAQVTDYAKVVAELEAARTNIKVLKKKLISETEHNKRQILTLQESVTKMQYQEQKAVASDVDIQPKLQNLKDLEDEAEELRKFNHSLMLENSNLAQKLEYVQAVDNSVLENEEIEALREEALHLRRKNEDLEKEIERLQADRCADVEELVYLRWINACLRYELRNYQPGPGKTIARDLSKTLSPKSEEEAKMLILEYANKECQGEKGINVVDFDFDHWSYSQDSNLTDSGEFDDSSIDNSSANKTNTSSRRKVFGKLMKLLRAKDGHPHSRDSSLEITPVNDSSLVHSVVSAGIAVGSDGHANRLRTLSKGSSRFSLDLQRSRSAKGEDLGSIQRHTDEGSSWIYRRVNPNAEDVTDSPLENRPYQDRENLQKSELVKYAEILKGSRGKSSKFRRRSASYSSC